MAYLDTSVVVAYYIPEPLSLRAQDIFAPLTDHAKGWALILDQCLLAEHPDWRKVIDTARSLIALEGDVPRQVISLRMFMAQAYAQIGEYQQALSALKDAESVAPAVTQVLRIGPPKPPRRIPIASRLDLAMADAYANLGRAQDALTYAADATRMSDATSVLIGCGSVCARFAPGLAYSARVPRVSRKGDAPPASPQAGGVRRPERDPDQGCDTLEPGRRPD